MGAKSGVYREWQMTSEANNHIILCIDRLKFCLPKQDTLDVMLRLLYQVAGHKPCWDGPSMVHSLATDDMWLCCLVWNEMITKKEKRKERTTFFF